LLLAPRRYLGARIQEMKIKNVIYKSILALSLFFLIGTGDVYAGTSVTQNGDEITFTRDYTFNGNGMYLKIWNDPTTGKVGGWSDLTVPDLSITLTVSELQGLGVGSSFWYTIGQTNTCNFDTWNDCLANNSPNIDTWSTFEIQEDEPESGTSVMVASSTALFISETVDFVGNNIGTVLLFASGSMVWVVMKKWIFGGVGGI